MEAGYDANVKLTSDEVWQRSILGVFGLGQQGVQPDQNFNVLLSLSDAPGLEV